MQVGILRYKYDRSGGAERTMGLLCRGLLGLGHQVRVVTTNWEGDRPPGLKVHYVFIDKHMPKWSRAVDWAVACRNHMAARPADVWLGLERIPGVQVYRAGDGCHAAWLEHRSRYESPLKRFSFRWNPMHRTQIDLERRTLADPKLHAVIANSHLVADELVRYYGIDRGKVKVIYNGVDEYELAEAKRPETRLAARRELGLPEGRKAALFLGSGWERKGLGFAIRALAETGDMELLVAGKDRPKSYLKKVAEYGLEGRVRFLGQRDDVSALLAAADCLVLPTIYDPCSNACLEALFAGLPVVTTVNNGAHELVDEGISGHTVERPEDYAGLAKAMQKACALEKGFLHRLPGRDEWLRKTVEALRQAAEAGN